MSYYPGSFGPIDWENASLEEQALVGLIVGRTRHWEVGMGQQFRRRCNRFFRQYREFESVKDGYRGASPPDRDVVLQEAQKKWGADLRIPQTFRAIEQQVPRMVANAPKLVYLPRDEQWVSNVEPVRLLIDAQQAKCNIDLSLQAVARAGLIYGIGVGKTFWKHQVKMRRRLEQHALEPSKWVPSVEKQPEVVYDDPVFEDVDVFDFMWDPYGFDMESCDWVVHRMWLSVRAIRERVESGAWNTESAGKLTSDTIRSLQPERARYTEIWQERMRVSGLSLKDESAPGEWPHEVLEYHDGERVLTVLDRQALVQDHENPCGEMPFQVYRPTPLGKQMVGVSMVEATEQLSRELNTLRSQRTDTRTISLAGGWLFDENAIERDDLQAGPDVVIPVANALPRDALVPIPRNDVPASGYEDEAPILRDLEAITGMSDAQGASPGGGAPGTATEATLNQSTLSFRTSLLTRRLEQEVVRPSARQFLLLDQYMIRENRPAMLVPGQGGDEQLPDAGSWRFFPVGPGELEGEYEIEPEGGSMEAKNIPQERNDAMLILQNLSHDFYINPTKARLEAMRKLGIKHPKSWLRSQEPVVPMATMRMLLAAGVDPSLLMQAVQRAREVEAPQEGPAANQITEQVGMEGT